MRNALRLLALAGAGAAALSATPAAAMTVVFFFTPAHFIAGYIIYANDGHICGQSGTVTGMSASTYYEQDC